MRSFIWVATVGIVALAATSSAQEPPRKPDKAESTKTLFMVSGLHCAACATTVEGSLKRVKGISAVKVDFPGKYARIEIDESLISVQEVAHAMSVTPHMMGRDMQYGGTLVLSVAGVNDEATGRKAQAALSKVEGVARVKLYPKQQAVGIEFAGQGTLTSKQLIETLTSVGLKGAQYTALTGSSGPGTNGRNGSMADHANMGMNNGSMEGMGGFGAMGQRMSCGCAGCGCRR